MFHVLHKVYVLTWLALLLSSAAWAYSRSGIADGLMDWYVVWQNKPHPVSEPAAELSGEVVKVIDGTSLAVRGDDRHFYSIALLGAVPLDKANSPSRGAPDPGKARLTELVLSNKVDVTLTWMDERKRGVGVVHMGRTNVNALMVESGLVKLNRQFIKPLPLIDQYALIRAERKANERRLAAAPNH